MIFFAAMQDHTCSPYCERFRNRFRTFAHIFLEPGFYLWVLLFAAGFGYVAAVFCGRANPFESRHGGYLEFLKLIVTLPFLYWLAGRHVLKPLAADWRRAVLWNGAGYVLPFFIALHWFYLQRIPQVNYSLTWADLQAMHPVGYAVFGMGGVILAALTAYHLWLARTEGILVAYCCTLLGAISLLTLISWALHGQYDFHIHHYFVFGFFIPWTRFKNPVSLVCQAVCAGIYVEGISEWSMATLWYVRH